MKSAIRMVVLYAVVISALCGTTNLKAQPVVYPGTDVAINDYTDIEPEIFSLNAYEGTPDFDPGCYQGPGLDWLEEWGIEAMGFPGSFGYVFAGTGNWWSGLTMAQIEAWFDGGSAWSNFSNPGVCLTDYAFGRILPAMRASAKGLPRP